MPPGLVSTEIAFADDTRGLLLNTGNATTDCQTQTVSLGKTVDGAASWQQVPQTGIADAMCKQGLTSADPTHAFLAASRPGTNPVIYRTADGGTSWTASAPLPTPPNLASHGALYITVMGRPRAFGSVILVEGGAGPTKDIFRSTDGGATFIYASAVTPEGAVAYVTATRWLFISPPDSSMETTDGGVTWHPYTTDYSQAAPIAPDVVFGDAQVGYATVRGAIQRTTDGGAHWTTIKTPGT